MSMTTSSKILVSAGVIVLLAFLQMGVAQQLVAESATTTFSLRSPILIGMSVVQLIFGIWALTDVSHKIKEDEPAPVKKAAKHAK